MTTTPTGDARSSTHPSTSWIKTYTHCRACGSPLNLERFRVSQVSGYCLTCQYRPAFVLRAFADGCREVSHPTRPGEWGSGPEHHYRLVAPWYKSCPNLRCSMGCVLDLHIGGRLRCETCWQRYKGFKRRVYPCLAALFTRYRDRYDTLFYQSARRPTKACPRERLRFLIGQSNDYRVCFEAILEAMLADTVEELPVRFAFNLQRFRFMVAEAPPEQCFFPDERVATLEAMLAELTAACEADLAAQVASVLAGSTAISPAAST